jgi:predicted RNA-binding Zn-ribbon protein involved in translation (DUF1610 family)
MRCTKTGRNVAPENLPAHVRAGDEFTCPACDAAVIVGMSSPFTGEADLLVRDTERA